jgi:nucleotide-binding universal stress UspA family protein
MKILLPVDFSDLNIKSMDTALRMISIFGGKITPFHAHLPVSELDEPYAFGLGGAAYHNFGELEILLAERLSEFVSEHIPSDKLNDPIISVGNPAQAIVDASDGFDYIVMTTHGRTGFTRFLLGSVAEKVLRLSSVPVLVVEEESEIDNFENILITTDFSDNATAAFPFAIKFAEKTGGKIDLLHILSFDQFDDDESDLSIKKLREQRLDLVKSEFFHNVADRVTPIVKVSANSAHEAILKHVKDNDYNLVIMSTIGRTGLNYLMMGSTTANVVRHIPTAVLSVNPRS